MEPKRVPRGPNYFADIASKLADGAERARAAGDLPASIHLAMVAAQYLQLARLFAPAPSGGKR